MTSVDIRIIHASDLHLSEELLVDPGKKAAFPHRYGHDLSAFRDLDTFLKNNHWDALVLSGDLSRVGNANSFFLLRNWLEGTLKDGELTLGLAINDKGNQFYVAVPGNHDCFNGKNGQTSLENYERQFPSIKPGSMVSKKISGIDVNFHLFDSTLSGGSFAYGEIKPEALGTKILNTSALDIAVLHHHFIQPPNHKRECDTEINNCAEVATHMLGTGYDAVFFGHTHKSYLSLLTTTYITRILQDKRRIPRIWHRLIPKNYLATLLRNKLKINHCTVSYARERTANGNYPSVDSYFKYLYLKEHQKLNIKGPAEHKSAQDFYTYLNTVSNSNPVRRGVELLKDKKTLISMAPSACQAEAKIHGLHEIVFSFESNALRSITKKIYQRSGSGFSLLKEMSSTVPDGNKLRG